MGKQTAAPSCKLQDYKRLHNSSKRDPPQHRIRQKWHAPLQQEREKGKGCKREKRGEKGDKGEKGKEGGRGKGGDKGEKVGDKGKKWEQWRRRVKKEEKGVKRVKRVKRDRTITRVSDDDVHK